MLKRTFLLLLLALLAALLSACAASWALPGLPSAETSSLAAHLPALRPGQEAWLEGLEALPTYRMQVRVDPAELTLSGQMTLTLPPLPAGAVPTELYFRLYPNLSHYGGRMYVDLVKVNEQGAPFSYAAADTAVHVAVPPTAIAPGQPVTVGIQWHLEADTFPSSRYTLFGESEGILSLPLFYPVLAVRAEGESGEWHLEQGLAQGDAAFSDAALYEVTVTLPEGMVVVSTGTVVAVNDHQAGQGSQAALGPGWKDWHIVTGPAREFAMFVSDQFRLAEAVAGDVRINSWYLPGAELTGRAAAEYAAAALRIYQDAFGPYPYSELDIMAGPLTNRGMEYPGLLELGVRLYGDKADQLEMRIAHEVGHQWWYNLVGSDPVNRPWLDEGLAEYATYFYTEKTRGKDAADLLAAFRWETAVAYARQQGVDTVVDQPVEAFQSNNYETMVYGKAALFFNALHQAMGDKRFLELLRRYASDYRFQIATPEDFLALAEEMAGDTATDLYRQYILEPEAVPLPVD